MNHTPIFILASERSGTNLLRAILSSHSTVASPPPAGLIGLLAPRAYKYLLNTTTQSNTKLFDDAVKITESHLTRWDIDFREYASCNDSNITSFWDLFFKLNATYADKNDASHWVSKEPYLFNYIYALKYHYPNARFIYLVRDGRDVASSMLRTGVHSRNMQQAARRWAQEQTLCLNAYVDPALSADMLKIKYENLIQDTKTTSGKIMNFVGLQFEDEQLKFYEQPDIVEHSKGSSLLANIAKPVVESNTNKYKQHLTDTQIKIFEHYAWDIMQALSYSTENKIKPHLSILDSLTNRLSVIKRNMAYHLGNSNAKSAEKKRKSRLKDIL